MILCAVTILTVIDTAILIKVFNLLVCFSYPFHGADIVGEGNNAKISTVWEHSCVVHGSDGGAVSRILATVLLLSLLLYLLLPFNDNEVVPADAGQLLAEDDDEDNDMEDENEEDMWLMPRGGGGDGSVVEAGVAVLDDIDWDQLSLDDSTTEEAADDGEDDLLIDLEGIVIEGDG
uniref:Uncharacterized protein n=1 Tax=Cyclophora tenuis TaxID=216820 RepID=A0A7S1D0S8_CYCTE